LEILGKPSFLSIGGAAVDDEAAYLMVARQLSLLGEAGERAKAPAARLNGEAALRFLRWRDN
jgi:hypothetical protein